MANNSNRWWEILDSIVNSAFFASYIAQTFLPWKTADPADLAVFQRVDLALALILLLQFAPHYYISFDRVGTFINPFSMITLASTLPVFWAFSQTGDPGHIRTFFGVGDAVYWYPTRIWRLAFSLSETVAPSKTFMTNLSLIAQKATIVCLKILITLLTITGWYALFPKQLIE